jgi:hypothetical protein
MDDGRVEYTITQPLDSKEDGAFEDEEETRKRTVVGSELDTEYLVCVQPDLTSLYQHEFTVQFNESGSFFVQVAYQEVSDVDKFTPPQYINVDPELRVGDKLIRGKELSILTVMSRCLGRIDRWE